MLCDIVVQEAEVRLLLRHQVQTLGADPLEVRLRELPR